MLVECLYARRIGGRSTKTDETVRPDQHRAAIGYPGFHRIKLYIRGNHEGHELAPTCAKIVQARRLPEDQEVVTRPPQADPAGKTPAGRGGSRGGSRATDEGAPP